MTTDSNTTQIANSATARRNLPGVVIQGRLANIQTGLTDINGKEYAKATLYFNDEDGQSRVVTAMAFGAACARIRDKLVEGTTVLYGVMDDSVFRIIKEGNLPQRPAVAA